MSCLSSVCPAGLDLSDVGRVATTKTMLGFRSPWLQALRFWCCSLDCSGMLCGTCLTFLGGERELVFGKRHFNHIVTKLQQTGFNNVLNELELAIF